jgi:hypothetical protein
MSYIYSTSNIKKVACLGPLLIAQWLISLHTTLNEACIRTICIHILQFLSSMVYGSMDKTPLIMLYFKGMLLA